MKWTDNSITKDILFKDLKVGEGFETDEYKGILIYNENEPEEIMIICSCCGGVYPLDEVDSYEKYPTWVDFSAEI